MSFLFELQRKKTNPLPVQKKVSMDVQAPVRSVQPAKISFHPLSQPAGKFSFGPQSGISFKRLDGVKTSVHIEAVKSEYAQRVSEMAQPKRFSKTQKTYSFSFLKNLDRIFDRWTYHIRLPRFQFTPNKLVYGSIMSGVAFGMISLGLIEKTFESNATASDAAETQKVETVQLETENYKPDKDVFMQYFSDAADAEYQANVRELVKGYPIEEMLPYIFEKDRVTAAFLIGIAKKESNWGKRRPVLDGQDCFNYWGYRGQRRLMGSGGHTCFNSRKDAVETVAKRLEELINSERLNTPAKLIVWKCGMSCEGHSRESVEKWIADVDAYYGEMMALEGENSELEEPADGS